MKTIHLCKQSGSSLVVVVISVLATLMVMVGVAAEYTWTVNRHVQRSNTLENAVAVGDSCIDVLFANWRSISRVAPTTIQTTNAFASIPLPAPSQLNLPAVSNFSKRGTGYNPTVDELDSTYTISNYKVIAVTPEWTALASADATPKPELGLAITGNINTTSANFDYIASADVTLPALGPTGKVVAKVRRVFQKQQLSPWNFAIFYIDPLEIHPGPQFTITGWVHTNSDLYTGHNTLTFADKVTFGSDWFAPTAANPNAGFKPGDGQHPEAPTAPNYPSNLPPAHDDAKQPFGLDSTQLFSTTDPNPNNDSYHELIEVPTSGYADIIDKARYWSQASVIIQVDGRNTVTIGKPHFDASGVADGSIDPLNGPTSSARDIALYNMFNTSGAITTNQQIQDNREGASFRLATLDISRILTAARTPTYTSSSFDNPIIYFYDSSATSHPLNPDGTVNLSINRRVDGTTSATPVTRGIRIKNGSKIPLAGLTIASNNPVYIQGDFNTGGNPPSNSGNPADAVTPQVSGYTRAPCSILADAINILSNSWVDSASGTAPTASNTTINAAIVSGIVPTGPVAGNGSYSGGAENFPRFLENWRNQSLTYYGSMVELYKSQQSVGEWGKVNVYSPPIRQWYFDSNFKTKPPPGSIMVYSYVKGQWSIL
jgi:hypothetical protein